MGRAAPPHAAFTLALYAILDVNIHYEGLDLKQVEDYLNLYFRISDSSVISTIYYDITENPANYLEYYVGYLEIMGLQREAKKTLGSRYTDMEFNRFLLDIARRPSASLNRILRSGWRGRMRLGDRIRKAGIEPRNFCRSAISAGPNKRNIKAGFPSPSKGGNPALLF